jgi:dTDP-4-amino-4,6-dideoxygalactose transaminase
VPPCAANEEFNTFHTFVVQIDRRDELQAYLKERGIKTAIHYPVPIHLQPAARALGYKMGDFPVTERQAERILTLPVNQYMSEADVETVAREVMTFLER